MKKYHQEYHQTNLEKQHTRTKEYRQNNREKELARVQEYREANREQIYAQQKEYREANRDTISKRRMATYSCACGSTCRIDGKAEHLRSQKHQAFITNLDVSAQTEY